MIHVGGEGQRAVSLRGDSVRSNYRIILIDADMREGIEKFTITRACRFVEGAVALPDRAGKLKNGQGIEFRHAWEAKDYAFALHSNREAALEGIRYRLEAVAVRAVRRPSLGCHGPGCCVWQIVRRRSLSL